ncbi:MAG: thioredoxin [Lachnospiraceae bacterium]|nr:thioredoxin [Butyrivibrio sp.]MBR0171993.1 thioredoxin [Lachnospiraceae bacterium]
MATVLNSGNFEAEVLQSDLPVLVDFYADWCGPCKMMSPMVEQFAGTFDGKLKVCKLNVDDAQDIAARYGVMSIPTFIFFKGGEAVHQTVGAVPQNVFEKEIASVLEG